MSLNTKCTSCGASAKKVVLNYTPKAYTVCPSPAGCPDELKCSEILDSLCFQYTGTNILYCDSTDIAVNKFENLENIITNILSDLCSVFCNIDVDITANEENGGLPSLTSTVTNGVAPYTYAWKIAQGPFVGHFISGSTTTSTLNLTCIAASSLITGELYTTNINENIKVSNIELIVTDANGCKTTAHFLYTSDCYSMIVDEPQPRQAFLGGRMVYVNGYETPIALQSISFMDDPDYMPTCEEIKNYCCVECFQSAADAETNYRINRDEYVRNLNENFLTQHTGTDALYPQEGLNYTQWKTDNLGDQTVFYKNGLMNYNNLWGCPECSYRIWSEIEWPQLNNQTLAERFPTINPDTGDIFVWIDAVPLGETPPIGQPGQLLKWATDPLSPDSFGEYAWDPVTNSWSEDVSNALNSIGLVMRERRNAWFTKLNQVTLAIQPFLYANDYALLHRFKYDLTYPV